MPLFTWFYRTTTILVLLFTCSKAWADLSCTIMPAPKAVEMPTILDDLHALPHGIKDAPHRGLHGQLLVGQERLYMLHLPVFMNDPGNHPHNFQVIAEVAFADPSHHERYRADRAAHSEAIYTAEPPVFDQSELVLAHEGRPTLERLRNVAIVRGHFERDGMTIIDDAELKIVRLVEFREFDPAAMKNPSPMYRLYGWSEETFLSHMPSAPPDYDQALRVHLAIETTVPAALEDVVEQARKDAVVIVDGVENTIANRLSEGDALRCIILTMRPLRALPVKVTLTIDEELYCEQGELSAVVTDSFHTAAPCN